MPIALVAAWQLYTVERDDPKFPRPTTIIAEFRRLWLFSQFDTHIAPSWSGSRSGSRSRSSSASPSASRSGSPRLGRSAAMPHIEYWRAIPPPALLPISILLLHSIGNLQKVSFIAFFCIFPVLLNTIDGVRGIEPTLIETARSFRVPPHEQIGASSFPAALPQIFAGMRTSLALAVIVMVLSEYFASTNGVGYVLLISKNTFQFLPMWGCDPADRRARLPAQPPFPPRRAARPRWHRGWRAATPL